MAIAASFIMAWQISPTLAADANAPLREIDTVPATARILIVNLNDVVANCDAAENVREQLETYRAAFQEEMATQEASLNEERETLERQRVILGTEEFQSRLQDFNENLTEIQRNVQERRSVLDRAFATANDRLRRAALVITSEYMESMEADLVIADQMVILADTRYDITEGVMGTLNDRLSEIEITITESDD